MLDLYAPLLAAPLCIAACYMSFTGYKLVQRDGAWPSGLLCAVAVWVFICIRVAFWDHRKARRSTGEARGAPPSHGQCAMRVEGGGAEVLGGRVGRAPWLRGGWAAV